MTGMGYGLKSICGVPDGVSTHVVRVSVKGTRVAKSHHYPAATNAIFYSLAHFSIRQRMVSALEAFVIQILFYWLRHHHMRAFGIDISLKNKPVCIQQRNAKDGFILCSIQSGNPESSDPIPMARRQSEHVISNCEGVLSFDVERHGFRLLTRQIGSVATGHRPRRYGRV